MEPMKPDEKECIGKSSECSEFAHKTGDAKAVGGLEKFYCISASKSKSSIHCDNEWALSRERLYQCLLIILRWYTFIIYECTIENILTFQTFSGPFYLIFNIYFYIYWNDFDFLIFHNFNRLYSMYWKKNSQNEKNILPLNSFFPFPNENLPLEI